VGFNQVFDPPADYVPWELLDFLPRWAEGISSWFGTFSAPCAAFSLALLGEWLLDRHLFGLSREEFDLRDFL